MTEACSKHRGYEKHKENLRLGKLKVRNPSIDGRIILKWVSMLKYSVRMWTEFIWLRLRNGGGFL